MSLVNCKEPNCVQLLEASCDEITTLFRMKAVFETIQLEIPSNPDLSKAASEELKRIEAKIKAKELEDENIIRVEFSNLSVVTKGFKMNTTRVLTLKCLLGHSHKYIVNCS
jgi:hypothetical protein